MVRLFKVPRILVVQDSSSPVVGLLHRKYDCQVDVTDSGIRAISYLHDQKYDLVIVDIELLNGTSRKVLAAVQECAPSMPVVATRVKDFHELSPNLVMVLSGQVTEQNLERLFQVFKIKARTRAIAEYFRVSRVPTAVEVS